ncbi:MAG: hypothetical protein K2H96_02295 [Muribaculaceae bacterium]|nr:hypothetical protein [Muribaculaceae bacterium]
MKRIKKSVWLPSVIFIYFICMTFMFAPELIQTGQSARLLTVAAVEIIVIIALHFFLKKREQIK